MLKDGTCGEPNANGSLQRERKLSGLVATAIPVVDAHEEHRKPVKRRVVVSEPTEPVIGRRLNEKEIGVRDVGEEEIDGSKEEEEGGQKFQKCAEEKSPRSGSHLVLHFAARKMRVRRRSGCEPMVR